MTTEPIYRAVDCEKVLTIEDREFGLTGYFVVGSRINGLTCGGLRIHNDVSIQELKDHAKVMELKQGFLGLPRGGARAGILADYQAPEAVKQRLMNRFAECLSDELQDRKWLAAIDVGTNMRLIQNMYRHIGVAIPEPAKEIDNAGYYTAVGVLKSIQICLELSGKTIAGSTFAVEGFGNVGSHLARLIGRAGGRLVAVSGSRGGIFNPDGLNAETLFSRYAALKEVVGHEGAASIPRESLLELDVDVLAPCAVDSTIHSGNINRIKAPIICAGANNPVTLPANEAYFARGGLYPADFLTNAGGALGNMVKFGGLSDKHFHRLIEQPFAAKIRAVHALAEASGISAWDAGFQFAEGRFAQMKRQKEQQSSGNLLFELALRLYRKGFVPKILTRHLAYRQLQKLLTR